MLTLQVASDLHFETHRDGGYEFIESMDPTGVDVLVLTGDILAARFVDQVKKLLEKIAAKYPHVLYVPGNHELWRLKPEEALGVLDTAIRDIPNVTLVNNRVISIQGRRFIGGPMWFPQWSPLLDYEASQFSDFQEIVDFRPWVVAENRKFQSFMEKNLKEGDVVLTHYLPSTKSIARKYQGAPTNAFFVCEMDQLIYDRSPSLWIHGHTHEPFDYQLSKTRIVCNPFGYPTMLNPGYKEKLLISVE